MGIDVHALNLLRFAAGEKALGCVAMIGRQWLSVPETQLRSLMTLREGYQHQRYCEPLLTEYLGAERVDSFDNSDYEGATYVADLNAPLDAPRKYDTVADVGSLEHIYNAPQAFKNVSELCKPGGQILHVLPANNLCGHGLWQFSPELLLSLYSEQNGYRETRVFLADLNDNSLWYEVLRPRKSERLIFDSPNPLYVLCRTTRGESYSHQNVQQPYYVFVWSKPETAVQPVSRRPSAVAKLKAAIRGSRFEPFARRTYELAGKALAGKAPGLHAASPHLIIERKVSQLM